MQAKIRIHRCGAVMCITVKQNVVCIAQVKAILHCHVTRLLYLQHSHSRCHCLYCRGCSRYSAAHPTSGGIVPRLRGGIVSLQPLYFLLNFVEDGRKWCGSESGIVAR